MNTKHVENCAVLAVAAVLLISSMVTAQMKGTFTDPRDKKTYRTVKIGKFTWMAENLNYQTKDSWCYDNDNSNCAKYGRLYTWDAAMEACPAGWRLPNDAEWNDLTATVGGSDVAGKKLKSKSGWDNNGNGTDDFGFSALPGGYRSSDGSFDVAGSYGYWWSATEGGGTDAYGRGMDWDDEHVGESFGDKSGGFSVRCSRD